MRKEMCIRQVYNKKNFFLVAIRLPHHDDDDEGCHDTSACLRRRTWVFHGSSIPLFVALLLSLLQRTRGSAKRVNSPYQNIFFFFSILKDDLTLLSRAVAFSVYY